MATLSQTNSSSTSASSVNIETQGPDHWIKWQQSLATNRKTTGATSGISTFSQIGTYTPSGYNNALRTISWTNGTPTASGSDQDGIYTGNTAVDTNGFSFTLDADTSVRTAKFYFENFGAAGRFSATLSDGSATMSAVDFTDPGNASKSCNITVTFQAASAGQTLTVSWVIFSHSLAFGNVAINGIALTIAAAAATFIPPARRSQFFAEPEAPALPVRPDVAAILAPAPVVNSPVGRVRRVAFDQPDQDLPQRRAGIAAAIAPAVTVAQVPFLARRTFDSDDQPLPPRPTPRAAPFNPSPPSPPGPAKAPQDWTPETTPPPRTVGVPLLPSTAPIAQPPIARKPLDWPEAEPPAPDRPQSAAILAPYIGAPAGPARQIWQDWAPPPQAMPRAVTAAAILAPAPIVNNPPGRPARPPADWDTAAPALPARATVAAATAPPPVVNAPPGRRPPAPTDWTPAEQAPARAGLAAAFATAIAAAVPVLRRAALAWPDEEAPTRARPSVAPAIAAARLIDPIPQRRAQPWPEEQPWTSTARAVLAALIAPAGAAPPPRAPNLRWPEAAEAIATARRQLAAIIAPQPPPPDVPPPRRLSSLLSSMWGLADEALPAGRRFMTALFAKARAPRASFGSGATRSGGSGGPTRSGGSSSRTK